MTVGTYTRGGSSAWWAAPMHMILVLLLATWSAGVGGIALMTVAIGLYPEGAACGLLSTGFMGATWAVA